MIASVFTSGASYVPLKSPFNWIKPASVLVAFGNVIELDFSPPPSVMTFFASFKLMDCFSTVNELIVASFTNLRTAKTVGNKLTFVSSALISSVLFAEFSLFAKPGTVGLSDVPPKSPFNCTKPAKVLEAFGKVIELGDSPPVKEITFFASFSAITCFSTVNELIVASFTNFLTAKTEGNKLAFVSSCLITSVLLDFSSLALMSAARLFPSVVSST